MGGIYANAVAKGAHHANLELVCNRTEVLHLLVERDIVIPLFRDAGVLSLLDLLLMEWLRHSDSCG